MRLHALERICLVSVVGLLVARPLTAQVRPLITQDPEPIGSGNVMLEGGIDYASSEFYPLSGLTGNLITVPDIGIIAGISSIAELQIDGGPYSQLDITSRAPAPLASAVTAQGSTTSDVEDIVVATKVRLLSETAERPAFAVWFGTRLPNAKHQSGLGQDTTDFSFLLLAGKTVQSVRIVGNVGFTIVSEPLDAGKQNDELTYGVSFARALTSQVELVGEVNGRVSTRPGMAPIGTESRGILKFGGRYTRGPVRLDAAVFFGLTPIDPSIGVTGGVTYVFHAFTVS